MQKAIWKSAGQTILLALLVQILSVPVGSAMTEDQGRPIAGGPPSKSALASIPRTFTSPPENSVILQGVPNYFWSYGCGPTSASMLLGYYARGEYPELFDVVPPLDNSEYGFSGDGEKTTGEIPFAISPAHVRDYWREFLSSSDPYRGNWERHAPDCLADFMGASDMARCRNLDGGTWVFYSESGTKHVSLRLNDGIRGIARYATYRGCSVAEYYTQIVGENGFSIGDYRAEIDAGRPVLVHTMTHMMLGVGYVPEEDKIVVHDNFNSKPALMNWAANYLWCGEHWACSVIRLDPPGTKPKNDGKIVVYDRSTQYVEPLIDNTLKRRTELVKVILQTRGQSVERSIEVRTNPKTKEYEMAEVEAKYDFSDGIMSGTVYSPSAEMSLMLYGPIRWTEFGEYGILKFASTMTGSGYGYTSPSSFAHVIKTTQKLDKKATERSWAQGMDLDDVTRFVIDAIEARGYSQKKRH
jgi:hypothetical protein